MSKMDKLARLVAKAASDKAKTSSYDTTAEVRRIEGSTAWVHIPDGVDETPVKLTIDAKAGDKVQIRVSGRRAWITGNTTAPPTDDTEAIVAKVSARLANRIAANAKSTADSAQETAIAAAEEASSAKEAADTAWSHADSAAQAATTAWNHADEAAQAASVADEKATAAGNAASAAQTSADEAKTSATNALTKANEAQASADTARASADSAQTSADTAANAASAALTEAGEAKAQAAEAESKATTAGEAATTAGNLASQADAMARSATDSANTALQKAGAAETAATAAQTSAENAEADAKRAADALTDAEGAAARAATSATNAAASESNAATSATSAATSATSAESSENAAATSATDAANSATAANTSAGNAANSATQAANSATSASTSATNAASSESAAATSASNAASSESNAATSESNAATSATNAATSATTASQKATAAANSATAAASSASTASTKASEATASASTAATKASEASASATQASGYATTAQQQASAASGYASAASDSADEAAGYADDAEDSATKSATSARDAQEKAAEALGQARIAYSAAEEAQQEATKATTYADSALDQLGVIQDVIGVLQWASEHGTFALTEDTDIEEGKVYFTYDSTTGDYTPVVTPVVSELSTYYELTVNEAMESYIMAHLAVTERGLWVLPSGLNGSDYKVLIADDGMYIYDSSGVVVAKYGATESTLSGESAVVRYSTGSILGGLIPDSHRILVAKNSDEVDYRNDATLSSKVIEGKTVPELLVSPFAFVNAMHRRTSSTEKTSQVGLYAWDGSGSIDSSGNITGFPDNLQYMILQSGTADTDTDGKYTSEYPGLYVKADNVFLNSSNARYTGAITHDQNIATKAYVDTADAKQTGIYTVKGTQTAVTGAWTGNIDADVLYDGMTIAYYLPYNGSGNATLNLTLSNGNTTGAINCYWSQQTRLTTHYEAGSTILFTYWSAGSIKVNGTATTDNRWTRCDYNSDYQTPYSWTAAGTAAKTVTCVYMYQSSSDSKSQWFGWNLIYANTYAGALTLNVNGMGAKPLYINGTASSSTNYTLPRGSYFTYYDGTNYYVRTDGKITGNITGNAATATTLATARTIQTNLASTSSASFNGSANVTPGVTGTLPIGNGGTGLTASPSMLTNLASTAAANVMQASPRPGVTGILPVTNGGTGKSSALTYSDVGAAASSHTHGNITSAGALQTTDITIASGDKLVVTDSSDSAKVARSSISFDGSTTTQALTKAGTFQTFNNYTHPSYTAATAAAVKVGRDSTGHVVLGSALTASDVGALSSISASTTGTGNAVTGITASGGAITVTKGTTFLTSHQDISGKLDKSGGTVTGDIVMYSESGNSPGIIFQRGTTTDSLYDWRIYDSGDSLFFGRRSTTDSFTTDIYMGTSGDFHAATLYGNGANLTGVVPSTRTVNSKALSANISLTASDVGALASVTTTGSGNAVTAITTSGTAITVTKGATYNNYTHPSYTATSAAAIKVGRDSTGHVVTGDALTYSDVNALPDYSLSIYDGTAGNPRVVKFCTIDYSDCDSNSGVFIKIPMRAGHGNGSSYNELQDVMISVNYSGTVDVKIFRYYAGTVTYDSATRYYGDVLYTIDTTNKVVKFYALMGQYSYLYMAPYARLNTSSKGTITQHTGTSVKDLSGSFTYGTVYWLDNRYATTAGSATTATTATSATSALSATKATNDSDGNAINTTYLKKSGGTMTGQLLTSFNSSVAMGSYQAASTTIPNLVNELRYSSGCAGSVSIGTAYTLNSITIATGWYNFLWIPHRSGGVNGSASGDNCNYGTLILTGMTVSGYYVLRYSGSSIAELSTFAAASHSHSNYLPLAGGIMTGLTSFSTENAVTANFRPGNANYYTTTSYQTSGDEALVFATKNAVTSFMFVNGEDSITNHASDRWKSLTPGLQIKNNCVSIGALIGNGTTTPTYKLAVSGATNITGDLTVSGKVTPSAIGGMNLSSGLLKTTTIEATTSSISAGSAGEVTSAAYTTGMDGYYPLALTGFSVSQAQFVFRRCYLTDRSTGSCKVYFNVRNVGSSAATASLSAMVIWIKNT